MSAKGVACRRAESYLEQCVAKEDEATTPLFRTRGKAVTRRWVAEMVMLAAEMTGHVHIGRGSVWVDTHTVTLASVTSDRLQWRLLLQSCAHAFTCACE